MKKISVIIPCYNVEQYIDRCIDSLLEQTIGLDSLELIFVNDASTDHTLDKLLAYEKQYEDSIMVINCEQNGKQGTARNIGMEYASCEYIGFVDADDWIETTMYEKLYEKAVSLDVDMAGCQADRIFSEADVKPPVNGGGDRHYVFRTDEDRRAYLAERFNSHVVCRLYRKSVIFDNEIFFPEGMIYEDNYWGTMLNYCVNSVYMLDEILYHYYVNPGSTVMKRNCVEHLDRLTIEEMKMQAYRERGLYERFRNVMDREFIQLYWLNSLHVFFLRFDEIPLEVFRRMQYTVMKYVPDYRTIRKYTKDTQVLIDLINLAVTQEDLDKIQKAYVSAFTKKE